MSGYPAHQSEGVLSTRVPESTLAGQQLNWLDLAITLEGHGDRPDSNTHPQTGTTAGSKSELFSERAKALWKALDQGEKGFLDWDDTKTYFDRKDLKGADAGVAVVLCKQFSRITNGTERLTQDDLKNLDSSISTVRKNQAACDSIETNADAIVATFADQSGRITLAALNNDSKIDPKFKDRAGEALDYIKKNFDTIQTANCDLNDQGISLSDLQKHVYNFRAHPDQAVNLVLRIDSIMERATALNNHSQDLYANKDNPDKSVVPEAVLQGDVGDCYFMAPAASLAELDPAALRKMIVKNENDTYTVTFPLSPDEHYTVEKPSQQELLVFAHGSEYGIWPSVLEKGYGAWIKESIWRRSILNPFPSSVLQENADGGSAAHHGLSILMGGFPKATNLSQKSDETIIGSELQTALQAKQPITTTRTAYADDYDLPKQHEYSLLRFNQTENMVTIRNPWGSGEPLNVWGRAKDGIDDGIFKMKLSEFKTRFQDYAIGRSYVPAFMNLNLQDLIQPVDPEM